MIGPHSKRAAVAPTGDDAGACVRLAVVGPYFLAADQPSADDLLIDMANERRDPLPRGRRECEVIWILRDQRADLQNVR
jgi:hypothetical protein